MSNLLIVGSFSEEERASLQGAADSAGLTPRWVSDERDVVGQAKRLEPVACLFSEISEQACQTALAIRADDVLCQLPLLVCHPIPDDLAFVEALGSGFDDLVTLSVAREFTARLRAIARAPKAPAVLRRGVAAVTDPDKEREAKLGRLLSAVGFELRYPQTPEDVGHAALSAEVNLLVIHEDLCPDPTALANDVKENGSTLRFILRTQPKNVGLLGPALAPYKNFRVLDAESPPDHVIYVANEMAAGDFSNKRASPRELYSVAARFRPEGHDTDDCGLTYNVSAEGIFVRTLAPPTQEFAWLELVPPRATRRVRLVGQVAWRRPFGRDGTSAVPPGFGFKIVDGARRDLMLWREGCGAPPAAVSMVARIPDLPA